MYTVQEDEHQHVTMNPFELLGWTKKNEKVTFPDHKHGVD